MNRLLSISLTAATALLLACRANSQTPIGAIPGAKSHFANFDTNKVHYLTAGKGAKTVVFIHGWSCNSGFWREQVPALADKASLVLIDLPGHGKSDQPHTAYSMDFFARAVLAVMRDARVDKATLVGHSMGTPVICRVYAQAPDKVAALVAVDGILRRPQMKPEDVERFTGPYRTPEYRAHVTNFVHSMFPNPGSETLRERSLSEMLATPQYVMSGAMDGMFGADQPAWDLPAVTVPVLVLNAKNPMWSSDYEMWVKSLSSRTDYRVLDGVGHFLMLEKPAEFNAALVAMLEQFDLVKK